MNSLNSTATPSPVASAVQLLLHDPQLPQVVEEFLSVLQAEEEKREQFYEEMSEEQKVEFINGEVIVHSPVKLRHSIISQNIFTLLNISTLRAPEGNPLTGDYTMTFRVYTQHDTLISLINLVTWPG